MTGRYADLSHAISKTYTRICVYTCIQAGKHIVSIHCTLRTQSCQTETATDVPGACPIPWDSIGTQQTSLLNTESEDNQVRIMQNPPHSYCLDAAVVPEKQRHFSMVTMGSVQLFTPIPVLCDMLLRIMLLRLTTVHRSLPLPHHILTANVVKTFFLVVQDCTQPALPMSLRSTAKWPCAQPNNFSLF